MISEHIPRRCMRDDVRDILLRRILDGTYPPGERLVELGLAREFQVSQAPVREALRELEAMGLVHSERYCGTRVREINTRDLIESYQLRALIEEQSVVMAVALPTDFLDEMHLCMHSMTDAMHCGDTARYIAGVTQFHRLIVQQSGNHLFLQTWDNLNVAARAHMMALRMGEHLPKLLNNHQDILQALSSNRHELAAEQLRKLFNQLIQFLSLNQT